MDFQGFSMDFPPHGFPTPWIFGEAAGAADKKQDWPDQRAGPTSAQARPARRLSWFFMVFHSFSWFSQGFLWLFHGFFKELDFKELEIHRNSLLDIRQWISTKIHQWISMDFHQWIHGWSINEYGHLSLGSLLSAFSLAPLGRLWAPWGPGRHGTQEKLWAPPHSTWPPELEFMNATWAWDKKNVLT